MLLLLLVNYFAFHSFLVVKYVNLLKNFQSREEGKDQDSIQSSTIPDLDHHMGSDKTQENAQHKSHFPVSDHKAAKNRQGSITKDKHVTALYLTITSECL